MAKEVRGASPADVPSWVLSVAALFKASGRWGFLWSWSCSRFRLKLVLWTAAAEDVGDGDEAGHVQKFPRALLYFLFSVGAFVQNV